MSKEINHEYDRPKLLAEKESIINKISVEKNRYFILSIIALVALLSIKSFIIITEKRSCTSVFIVSYAIIT